MTERSDGTIQLSKKAAKVRNKAPNPVQITAEQLLHEAKDRELEAVPPPPRQRIIGADELSEVTQRKRREFENNIRKNRTNVANWTKYAKWEESIGELQRARSVFERALDCDHRNISLWIQYAEMEMRVRGPTGFRNKQVNHARNIWDRAVTILPRASQFWFKYTYMEELLGNIGGCRQVFERWMDWEPNEQAWSVYIKFELRYKEIDRARSVYQRFVNCHPDVKNWIRYAKFEGAHGNSTAARQVYEQACEYFGDEGIDEKLLIAFAKFEEAQKEQERARVIYKFALDHLPKDRSQEIYKHYIRHEKRFGGRPDIENVMVSMRKQQYENQIKANPHNYDAWFDYIRLLESDAEVETIRDAYERAIANVPLQTEKRFWRRYIYLWINYALYEELSAQDLERTRDVYKTCLEILPHAKFTFSKMWVLYAKFEIRQKNLDIARKIMGRAIGQCPKDKSFREYINLELELREFDRCRILYNKWLEFSPENCTTWIKFAEMEELLEESDRVRALFDLAIDQPRLDMPEVLWKAYIDFEIRNGTHTKARRLYETLLQKTQHVKVWLSFATFEQECEDPECIVRARGVFRRGNKQLADSGAEREERLMLLEAWRLFETEHGSQSNIDEVLKEMPKRVKKRRKIETEDGMEAGWEEYYDYIFPSDETAQGGLKLLALAKKWKKTHDEDPSGPPGPSQESATQGQEILQDEDENMTEGEKKVREGDSDTDIESSSSEEEQDNDDDRNRSDL